MIFLKKPLSVRVDKALLGFASGVMIAASVWSLLIPSIEITEAQGKISWFPPLIGFLSGVVFLLIMDTLIPHIHMDSKKPEGIPAKLPKTVMMLLAVTLHNVPEGMAVGVAYVAAGCGDNMLSDTSALALSLGIAIQNFPEGAIISLPLRAEGMSRFKAFLCGVISGAVEPAAAFITALFVTHLTGILPYILAFAA